MCIRDRSCYGVIVVASMERGLESEREVRPMYVAVGGDSTGFLARFMYRALEMAKEIDEIRTELLACHDFEPYEVFNTLITKGARSISPKEFVDAILHMTSLTPSPHAIFATIERQRQGNPQIEFETFVRFIYPLKGANWTPLGPKKLLKIYGERTIELFSKLWSMLFAREEEMQAMKLDLSWRTGGRLIDLVAALDRGGKGFITLDDLYVHFRTNSIPISKADLHILSLEFGFETSRKSYQEFCNELLPL
eukprot:TRINITY_DN14580_c0_g1_i2.p1 TRINITY_DN14580_c0_g1~~TRINITY_DN14580_c0_g1_i2.p1  ORF type:complete len:270 (-),score=60.68 TRINITY_DN14580_c0_g1_i2:36-788(-)